MQTVKIPFGQSEIEVPQAMIDDLRACREKDGSDGKFIFWLDDRADAPVYGERCDNCLGPEGQGRIWAPTGGSADYPYYMGFYRRKRQSFVDEDGNTKYREVTTPRRLERERVPYDCPVCAVGQQIRRYINLSGLQDEWGEIDTTIYEFDQRTEFEQTVKAVIESYIHQSPSGWLGLVGGYGSGKSAMGKIIVKRCVEAGIGARFVDAHTMTQAVYDTLSTDGSPDLALAKWRDSPVLVVDELDWAETRSAGERLRYGVEHVLNMLNQRYKRKQATVIISPLDWWKQTLDGGWVLNADQAGDWAALLSRASEWDVALTTCEDLRPVFSQMNKGIPPVTDDREVYRG